jgi:hypothetical protein
MDEIDAKLKEIDEEIARVTGKKPEEMTEAELFREKAKQDDEFIGKVQKQLDEIKKIRGEKDGNE